MRKKDEACEEETEACEKKGEACEEKSEAFEREDVNERSIDRDVPLSRPILGCVGVVKEEEEKEKEVFERKFVDSVLDGKVRLIVDVPHEFPFG